MDLQTVNPETILLQAADNATHGTVGQPITYEKIPTQIFADSKEASNAVAQEIADLIRQKQKEDKSCVLGLATGSSPKRFMLFWSKCIERKVLALKT